MQMLERRIDALKRIIEAHDGENVADATFRREVDAVVDQFYDDIGRVTTVSARWSTINWTGLAVPRYSNPRPPTTSAGSPALHGQRSIRHFIGRQYTSLLST